VILEFSQPSLGPFRRIYEFYLNRVIPLLGYAVTRDRASYEYLKESILGFPSHDVLAAELTEAGFRSVRWERLTFGTVAVHVAEV